MALEKQVTIEDMEYLEKLMNNIQANVTFTMSIVVGVLGVAVAIAGVALFLQAKTWVNNRVDKELDKRLIAIMEKNPPVFSATGMSRPDENKRIYLSPEINGMDQLEPDQVLIVTATPKTLLLNSTTSFNPIVHKDDKGRVEIEFPDYDESNGLVHWRLVWARKRYTI